MGKRETERNEKEKNKETAQEAGSGLLKLFISLFYNYVFKSIQLLVTPRSLWLLNIFQGYLKSYDCHMQITLSFFLPKGRMTSTVVYSFGFFSLNAKISGF